MGNNLEGVNIWEIMIIIYGKQFGGTQYMGNQNGVKQMFY